MKSAVRSVSRSTAESPRDSAEASSHAASLGNRCYSHQRRCFGHDSRVSIGVPASTLHATLASHADKLGVGTSHGVKLLTTSDIYLSSIQRRRGPERCTERLMPGVY